MQLEQGMERTDPFDLQSPFESLERARRERLLLSITNGAIPALSPVTALFGFMLLSRPSWQILVVFSFTLLMIPMNLWARSLVKRGQTDLGSHAILIYFLIVVGINGLLIEDLFSAIAPAYGVILVMAGMLLGTGSSYVMAIIASMLWVLTWVSTNAGWVTPAPMPGSLLAISLVVIVVISFLFIAFMSQLATSDLRRALNDATYDLVQVNRKLEKASKLKSQFTARTSHELRTPLSAIIVFTDLALRKAYGPLDPRLEESLGRVFRNANRLHALIEDILDLSKMEAGEIKIVEEAFPVSRLLDTVRTTLETAASKKNIPLSLSISPDMPHHILGDEKRLSQVLLNLTDNAIKFTEEGQVSVSINSLNSDQWQILVRDTGRGINEKDAQAIFEEFRQIHDTHSGKTKGTGLGLTISRHLVKMMGGDIQLQSEIGKGSVFQVVLPLKVHQLNSN